MLPVTPSPSWHNGPEEPNPRHSVGTCKSCDSEHFDASGDAFETAPCACYNLEGAECTNRVCGNCDECSDCHQRACVDCLIYARSGGVKCAGCFAEYLADLDQKASRSTNEIIASFERLTGMVQKRFPVIVIEDCEASL